MFRIPLAFACCELLERIMAGRNKILSYNPIVIVVVQLLSHV